jgi:hypothetical protein
VSGSVADDEAVVGAVDKAVLAEGGAYGGVTAAPLDGEKPKKAAAKKPDLVIACVYNYPDGFTLAQEQELVAKKAWSPSTVDFETVVRAGPRKGTPLACNNIGEFLGILQGEPKGSLSRVVLVSHSTKGLIGFGGSITADGSVLITLSGGQGNPLAGGLDLSAINGLAEDYQPTLDDVKTRWAEGGGEIVFFSCGTGNAENLANMQDFAKLLGARAKGYSYEIGYCLENGRGHTTRTYEVDLTEAELEAERNKGSKKTKRLVIPCENAKLGYAHLTPDRP